MHHLTARVHAAVGAPGAGQRDLGHPQHGRQRRRQLALDGPQPRLRGPAVEVGAVVGDVEADPHPRHPLSDHRSRLGDVADPAIILVSEHHADVLLEEFQSRYAARLRPAHRPQLRRGRVASPEEICDGGGRWRCSSPTPGCRTSTHLRGVPPMAPRRRRPPAGSSPRTGTTSSRTARRCGIGHGQGQVRRLPADAARQARRGVPQRHHRPAVRLDARRCPTPRWSAPRSSRPPTTRSPWRSVTSSTGWACRTGSATPTTRRSRSYLAGIREQLGVEELRYPLVIAANRVPIQATVGPRRGDLDLRPRPATSRSTRSSTSRSSAAARPGWRPRSTPRPRGSRSSSWRPRRSAARPAPAR